MRICECGHDEELHTIEVDPDAGPVDSPCSTCGRNKCREFTDAMSDDDKEHD